MKKVLLIVVALFIATRMSAQSGDDELVSLLKVNFEGVTPAYTPTGDNIMKIEPTDEGLALINPVEFDTRWWRSEMFLTDDCLMFQKKHNYIVRLTMKVPHKGEDAHFNKIAYTVRVGNNTNWTQSTVGIEGDDNFQVVDFEVPSFPYDIEGDGHIIIKHQFVTGITTILKEVEVFEEIIPEAPVVDGVKLLCDKNWEGVDARNFWDGEEPDWDVEGTDEGLAITNPTQKENFWEPQVPVVNEFDLERNRNYVVRLTMKVPSDGTYIVRMGNMDASVQYDIPVVGIDGWQVIDIGFPDFCGDIETGTGNLIEDCFVFLCSGWVTGTTVVKKAEVYEVVGSGARGNTTAVHAEKVVEADGSVHNLTGQKVDASYKGIVIQNGKKMIVK